MQRRRRRAIQSWQLALVIVLAAVGAQLTVQPILAEIKFQLTHKAK